MQLRQVVCLVTMMIIALYAGDDALAKDKKRTTKVIPAELNAQIIATANYYHLDPNLLAIIIRQESGFNTQATSNKGAMGLMQMIPSTARRFGVTNAYDPNQSLHGGSRYLVWLLRKFRGRLDLALAGYNAGEGAVEKFGYRVPPYQETQHYVRSITLNYLATLGKRPISTATANASFNKSIKSNSNSKGNNSAKSLSKRELSKLATLDEVWSRSN